MCIRDRYVSVSSLLLLRVAAWRSVSALYRCTRREISTGVVTDIIWTKRRSLQTKAFPCYQVRRTMIRFFTLYKYTYVYAGNTGCFKRKTQNSFRCQCPRRFGEFDPEILHTCLVCPCRAFNECFFFVFCFFRQIFGVLYLLGIFGL